MEHRFISKRFKCNNCQSRFKKLVHYAEERTKCDNCGLEEATVVEENEFNREEADRTYRIAFDHQNQNFERQCHPRTDIFDRDPANIYGDARRASPRQEGGRSMFGGVGASRPTSTTTSQRTSPTAGTSPNVNYSQQQFTSTAQSQQEPRRRPIYRQIFIPYRISPFNGTVRRQPMDNIFSMFDSFFFIPNTDFFMDNFASNFSSNFEDPLTRIVFLQSMQNQPTGNPPASKEALKSLKKFQMNQEFCKKDEKGTLEFPSCSVCLTEIQEKVETILIPCGHMFHEPCITKWLEMHNTCPVCRYELPTEDPDYERQRQQRTANGTVHTNSSNRASS